MTRLKKQKGWTLIQDKGLLGDDIYNMTWDQFE